MKESPEQHSTSFRRHPDAGELCRQVKRIGDCMRKSDGSGGEELAEEGPRKKVMKRERGPLVSGGDLYKQNVVAVSRRQMAVSSWQDVFYSSQDVLTETNHSGSTLHGQKTQEKMRERVMA